MTNCTSPNYYENTNRPRNRPRNASLLNHFIPGLRNSIDLPFPDRTLPVCQQCKAEYRTRNQCRLEDRHTDTPWNTTHVCVILDDSCLAGHSHGDDDDLRLVDEDSFRFTARSIDRPQTRLRAKSDCLRSTKSPSCTACKEKGYARYHCREMKKHRELPWVTAYVVLSATPRIPRITKSDGLLASDERLDLDVGSTRALFNLSNTLSHFFGHYDNGCNIKKEIGESSGCSAISTHSSTVVESGNIQMIEPSRSFLMRIENDRSCELSVSKR